jgi:hypothetical protein
MGLLADQDREPDQTSADSLLPHDMALHLRVARRCSRVTGNAGTGSVFHSGWSVHMQGNKLRISDSRQFILCPKMVRVAVTSASASYTRPSPSTARVTSDFFRTSVNSN